MHPTAPVSRAGSSRRLIVLALLMGSSACQVPNFEGPQIQSPPPAFYRQSEAYQQRRMFPERALVSHDAWVETSGGGFSGIYLNGHEGVIGQEEVRAAREEAIAAALGPITFDNVEALTIDGRRAWGWAERLETQELGVDWIAYRAVVAYDTVSYALEFFAGEPGLKRYPDSLRVILGSFAIGRTEWNLPLIAIFAGMTLFLVSVVRSRAKARAMRLQSINLVTIRPKEEDEAADDSGSAPSAAPGSSDPAGSGSSRPGGPDMSRPAGSGPSRPTGSKPTPPARPRPSQPGGSDPTRSGGSGQNQD